MGRVVPDQVGKGFAVWINLSRLDCVTELRLVTSDRLQLCLEGIRDVDHERRLLVVLTEGERVQNLEGPVYRSRRLDFLETCDEARISYELGDDRVIRMPAMQ